MADDVYERLAQHLDSLPYGYPRTDSGVEMRILRRLFTPEDAELAVHVTLIAEEPRVIARRAKIPVDEAARRLELLDQRGLVYSTHQEGRPLRYQAVGMVVGFWEFQVNRLDPDLIRDVEEYLPTYFDLDVWEQAGQLRTVPVGESIPNQKDVMPYELVEELVRAQETLGVANCICRQEKHILGEGCDKPVESCLTLGPAAEHAIRNGRSRQVSQEEALSILRRAEEEGLVLQPANSKDPIFICTCCGCCCGVLNNMKRHPQPATIVSSPYFATLDADACEGCGICESRCQMEAIYLDGDTAVINLDRCIGCGLCVSTCPTDALALLRKPEADQPYVPKDVVDVSIKMGQARGMMGIGELVGMQLRSTVDRLLAPR